MFKKKGQYHDIETEGLNIPLLITLLNNGVIEATPKQDDSYEFTVSTKSKENTITHSKFTVSKESDAIKRKYTKIDFEFGVYSNVQPAMANIAPDDMYSSKLLGEKLYVKGHDLYNAASNNVKMNYQSKRQRAIKETNKILKLKALENV